jgi:HK97 family phage prohead protease
MRTKNQVILKWQGGEVKDLDLKKRTVTGYFAKFETIDSEGDVFVKGAFKKSIEESFKRIKHLLHHNFTHPVGAIKRLEEDDFGLYFESYIPETQAGDELLKMYDAGIYNEHSVGFRLIKGESTKDAYLIKEVQLFEGSTVTWGANSETPFLGFKDLQEITNLKDKNDFLIVITALKDLLEKNSPSLTGNEKPQTDEEVKEFLTRIDKALKKFNQ